MLAISTQLLNMILAFFLIFVKDFSVLIAGGTCSEDWHRQCPNTNPSELIKQIWEENRSLSQLFLDLDPDSASPSGTRVVQEVLIFLVVLL